MSAEAQLKSLQVELPPAPKPGGVYKPVLVVGDLVYVSGHGPLRPDGTLISGRVGADLDQQAGYDAARQTGLAIVATLRANFGDLDKIERIVKTLGMVNAAPDFTAHPSVINGFSELIRDLYGPEKGVGARSAVGMGSLPGNIAVEVEAIFQLKS